MKSKVNFIIDAIMMLLFTAIAGISFLIKYVLVPGSVRWEKYGRNVELSWLGMDRHEWGSIHFYIGLVLIALLILHIILHWRLILSMFEHIVSTRSARLLSGSIFVILCVIMLGFALFVDPEVIEQGRGNKESLGCGGCSHAPKQIDSDKGFKGLTCPSENSKGGGRGQCLGEGRKHHDKGAQ